MIRLKEKYEKEAVPKMMQEFGYKNKMAVPKIEKVVVNVGFGKMLGLKTPSEKQKIIEEIVSNLSLICGQKPVPTKAKKAISGFKLKRGEVIGAKVTLRKQRMYDFLERLIHIALPRSSDFHGIPLSSFDEKGNLTIGIRECTVFPEISPEKVKIIFPFEITIVTTAKSKEEGKRLLELMGFPLKK
jgi:large subunit ribosomal protein L5